MRTSVYRGVLSSEHLRAAIRTGLRAHGFTLEREAFLRAVERQGALASGLRADLFSGHEEVAEADPYLWDRLPIMAALGHGQVAALQDRAWTGDRDGAAARLGATFNSAIAVLDYLVDERAAGEQLFRIVDLDVVRGIFDLAGTAPRRLAGAAASMSDPGARLLLALVASCAEQGRALRARHAGGRAWEVLGGLVERMLEAEREVALAADPSPEALSDKSVLPSFASLQIAALASGREPPGEALAAAEALGRLFSLVDDLADLLEDSRRGVPTPVVMRLAARAEAAGRPAAVDCDAYNLVDEATAEIVALLASCAGPEGPDRLEEFARLVVAGWAGWHEDAPGVELPVALAVAPGDREAVAAALRALLRARDEGYAEAQHHLHFPRLAPDGAAVYETHPALLPFRAVALDALLDARDAGVAVPGEALHQEALAILRVKHRDVRGGWTYIPEVPELPPDADDVGQVLQVLARLGGPPLAATCEEPVRLALDATEPSGGFPTWIVDPRGTSPADRRMRSYLPIMGGGGIHAEVVANLLYGLVLYDRDRYRDPLRRGVAYLEEAQEPEGWWESKWYAGPFYGTYRALYVLGALDAGDDARRRARDFLIDAQHSDGSWGEPLSTALALLALHTPGMEAPTGVGERGLEYLTRTQSADGSWQAVPWIAFPTTDGAVSYGSRTMTTAFCVKALLAAGARVAAEARAAAR